MTVLIVLGGCVGLAAGCNSSGGNEQNDAAMQGDANDAGALADRRETTVDTGPDAPCGVVTCEVCDVSGYSALGLGATTQMLNACTSDELQSFVTACFSSTATSATCQQWQKTDSGTCGTCLSPVAESAPAWGPFYCPTQQGACPANQAGCVDLVLGTASKEKANQGSGSCGDALSDLYGCEAYACSQCASPADVQACQQDTESTGTGQQCATRQTAAFTGACAVLQSDAAPAAVEQCFPQTDTANVAFVNVFCGTGAM